MISIRRVALPFLLALLSVFMAVPACGTGGTPPPTNPGTPSPGTTFTNCTEDAGRAVAQQLVPQVLQALATGNYVGALATLATQFGTAEVVCAVQLAVGELQQRLDNTPSTAAPDPLVVTQMANAKAWLALQASQPPAAK